MHSCISSCFRWTLAIFCWQKKKVEKITLISKMEGPSPHVCTKLAHDTPYSTTTFPTTILLDLFHVLCFMLLLLIIFITQFLFDVWYFYSILRILFIARFLFVLPFLPQNISQSRKYRILVLDFYRLSVFYEIELKIVWNEYTSRKNICTNKYMFTLNGVK